MNVHVCVELATRTICGDSDLLDDQAPFTCSDSSLHIDLAWTATGSLDHIDRFHNRIFFPEPCHINELGTVSSRQAEVSGSITDGTTDFIARLNTVYAEIVKFRADTTGRGEPDECL